MKIIIRFPRLIVTVFIAMISLMTVSCNTGKSRHTSQQAITGMQDSLLVDSEINKYPVKKMPDNNFWMTANLNINIPGSYCYDNAESNCELSGRLYTWEAAQKGCALLGDGWRLPTNDEWRKLALLYGDSTSDSVTNRKKAFTALMLSGVSGFNAVLGGGRDKDGGYRRGAAHGFYWTATETDSLMACFANFGKNSQSLYHQNGGDKTDAFAVRCIRSVGIAK